MRPGGAGTASPHGKRCSCRFALCRSLLAALLTLLPAGAHAQLRATLLAGGFDRPNGVVVDPVVPGAAYVVDQTGIVRAFLNGVERPTPLLDLRSIVAGGYDERGLLGLAFPPDAAATGRVFVNFVKKLPSPAAGDTIVARFTRSAADPMVARPGLALRLEWPGPGPGTVQPFIFQPYENHNGGHLVFGPDGYLYIGLGDGGSGNDPQNRAQDPAQLLGKMLRMDVAVPDAHPRGYIVPPTNPMLPGALPEIWAFGLRNPWRYNFDDLGPGATGALVIADVGSGRPRGGRLRALRPGRPQLRVAGLRGHARELPGGPGLLSADRPPCSSTRTRWDRPSPAGTCTAARRSARPSRDATSTPTVCRAGFWSLQLTVNPATGDATAGANTEHTLEMGGPFNCISAFARDPAGELYFMDFDAAAGHGTGAHLQASKAPAPPRPARRPTSPPRCRATRCRSAGRRRPRGGTPAGYIVEAGTSQGSANLGIVTTTTSHGPGGGRRARRAVLRARTRHQFRRHERAVERAGRQRRLRGAPAPPAVFTATVVGTAVTLTWTVAAGTTATVIDAGLVSGATALSHTAGRTDQQRHRAVGAAWHVLRARPRGECLRDERCHRSSAWSSCRSEDARGTSGILPR